MEWHDVSCPQLDLAQTGKNRFCLTCGSVEKLYPQDSASPVLTQTPSSSPNYTSGQAPLHHHPPIHQKSETRVLKLEPGKFEDPICGTLFVVNLSSDIVYEALSYTWADESGDATPRETIQLDGCPFLITRNCENALRRLRGEYVTRTVWVDAICIDQTNISERGHQVQLMPKIYAHAYTVLIYIGEDAYGSDKVISAMKPGVDTQTWSPGQHVIQDLVGRRYFHRIWVLQEVALARRARLICGGSYISWHVFKTWMESYSPPIDDVPVFKCSLASYSDPSQLIETLNLASLCDSQDPRDKVFALLGLLPHTLGRVIVPDYSRSVEEVYADVARYIASLFSWSKVFQLAVSRHRPATDWPSWVPDWRKDSDLRLEFNRQNHRNMPIQPSSLQCRPTLEVQALKMPGVPGNFFRRNDVNHTPFPTPLNRPSRYYVSVGKRNIDFASARVMAFRGQDTMSSRLENLENAFSMLLATRGFLVPGPKADPAAAFRLNSTNDGSFRIDGPGHPVDEVESWIQRSVHMTVVDLKKYLQVEAWDNFIAVMTRLISPGQASTSASEILEVLEVAAATLTPIDEEAEALWPVPNDDSGGKSADQNGLIGGYAFAYRVFPGEIWARANTRFVAWKILLRLFLVTDAPVSIV
ncbi:HET-domain-containing protein [Apiospora sp. TS-2023a]